MTNRGTTAIRWAAAGVGVVAMMWMPGLAAPGAEDQPPRPLAAPMMTAWAEHVRVKPSLYDQAFPDIQMWRGEGDLLDGLWDLAITDSVHPGPPGRYDMKILVPFPVESALSRVMKPLGPRQTLWYRQTFDATKNWGFPGRRVLLHFNGVAGETIVWINGKPVGRHAGDWDEFAFDITDALVQQGKGVQEVQVGVLGPAGGSDASRPAGAGIWRTVWLEPVHGDRIVSLTSTGDAGASALRVRAQCAADKLDDCIVQAVALDRGSEIARAEGKPGQTITLPIGAPRLWSPDCPVLYDLRVTLLRGKQRLDRVESFFAIRTVAVGNYGHGVRRIFLNGKPLFPCGVTDAGRWPDGLSTPPTDLAVRREIQRMKQLGFNMVRKRGKVESDYWYFLCDRLGLMVWQDLPVTAGPAGQDQAQRIIAARANHPSIVAWVIDGAGRDRADLARLAAAVKRADPTRLVWVANVPPDAALGDVVDRRALATSAGKAAGDLRADVLVLARSARAVPGHTWTPIEPGGQGASAGQLTADLLKDAAHVADLRDTQGLAGAILGEWTDDEAGRTGLLTYDRAVVKADPELLASAAGGRGVLSPHIRVVLATARAGGAGWRYAPKEAPGWPTAQFDDAAWPTGAGGFGVKATTSGQALVRTDWAGGELFLRRPFTLDLAKLRDACLLLRAAGEVEVFFNGRMAMKVQGLPGEYLQLPLDQGALESLRPGPNVLALRCRPPKDAPPFVDAGLIEFPPQRDAQLPATLAHWPLLDVFMRDTCICVGPDGTYYLTGTTGNWGDEGIRIWKSKDLAHWDDLGLVWTPEKNATWQLRNRPRKGFCLWAPELHYLKGTFWITYCVSYPPTENGAHGTGLLKSTTGQAAGPYLDTHPEGPMSPGLDATLFEDDDGKVYFLWGGNSIVRMKDDMSGFAEKPRSVGPVEGGTVGFEGIFLFKVNGRYYLSATASGLPERDYDCMVAIGDNPYGPFHGRYKAVAHGGHNMFFKDTSGRWWCTMFGGGWRAPLVHRPGILRVEFAPDGKVRPVLDPDQQ